MGSEMCIRDSRARYPIEIPRSRSRRDCLPIRARCIDTCAIKDGPLYHRAIFTSRSRAFECEPSTPRRDAKSGDADAAGRARFSNRARGRARDTSTRTHARRKCPRSSPPPCPPRPRPRCARRDARATRRAIGPRTRAGIRAGVRGRAGASRARGRADARSRTRERWERIVRGGRARDAGGRAVAGRAARDRARAEGTGGGSGLGRETRGTDERAIARARRCNSALARRRRSRRARCSAPR